MLIDIRELPENTLIESDICIVGAGAAGIALAQEFIDQPYQVCLLESGGLDFEEATQSLYQGEHIGVPFQPLGESRARYLGGSTNLWGGWSRPLDDIDFEYRPWMPYSGWPIPKAELNPYYQRAQKVSGLRSDKYDFAEWEDALKELQIHRPPLPEQIETYIWQIVPPTHLRFGQAYKAELEQASNIKTYLHANVVEIETNDPAKSVTRMQVATPEGKKFWVSAKAFILAVGGIENPRLLLASNQVQSNGLGNQHDLVGRFFMEHPYLQSGEIEFSEPPVLYTKENIKVGETFLGTALGLSKQIQQQEQLLNFCTRLVTILPDWVEAFNSLKFKLRGKKGIFHEAFPTITEGQRYRGNTSALEDLSKVIANLDRIAVRAYAKLFDKSFYTGQSNLCKLHLIGEQAPNPDSRITLSSERDRLGVNRVQLDWRLSPIDKYTIQRSQELIAEEFARSGLGKVQIELTNDESWDSVVGSYHHMGTTRMSTNPSQGVVNQDCRVHGISNLYVAGSSVFPTSGLSNPTLTLIALAIRLADHLKETMAKETTNGEKVPVSSSHHL
ncbi:MAG: GMC family oxidoreductase [Xenococcaceae cyanobacterium MO_188.B32]|nr:GMC family oxidoreductase [Xenococcaceae cyanobacterium MO_188.B32]